LGGNGQSASFSFQMVETISVESGGPSSEFANGQTLHQDGHTISGIEGNGTIQFHGTFSSISWKTPQEEGWFGFTIGLPRTDTDPSKWKDGWVVKTYRSGTLVNNLRDADALIQNTSATALGILPSADMVGDPSAGPGRFSINHPVLGIPQNGRSDNFAVQALGMINV